MTTRINETVGVVIEITKNWGIRKFDDKTSYVNLGAKIIAPEKKSSKSKSKFSSRSVATAGGEDFIKIGEPINSEIGKILAECEGGEIFYVIEGKKKFNGFEKEGKAVSKIDLKIIELAQLNENEISEANEEIIERGLTFEKGKIYKFNKDSQKEYEVDEMAK